MSYPLAFRQALQKLVQVSLHDLWFVPSAARRLPLTPRMRHVSPFWAMPSTVDSLRYKDPVVRRCKVFVTYSASSSDFPFLILKFFLSFYRHSAFLGARPRKKRR